MARKPLAPEEKALLRDSPYVETILKDNIIFTSEFKKKLYEELVNGKSIRTTLSEHNIDPRILGDRRIWDLASRLRANADREEGFNDLRSNNYRKPAKESPEQKLTAQVQQLQHELAYTRQEVEFLKKLYEADSEVRKSWESKRRRK